MNTRKIVFSLLITVLFTTACSDLQLFRLEVLKPGFVVVPSQKTNILMVDNTGVQPRYAGHTVKINFRIVGDTVFDTEPLSGYLLQSLSNYLLKEGFYHQIRTMDRTEFRSGKVGEDDFMHSTRLSNAQIRELSKDPDAQLLISLDRLLTRTTTNTFFTGETYVATRDVWINTVWRVYDLEADSVVAQFQYNDSLFWEKTSNNSYMASKLLPPMKDVLAEIGDVVAENVHVYLGPYWETEQREYFSTGGYRMKMAADLVRKGRLDEAAELWRVEVDKGLLRSKYRAAMNMMFYEEVKGHPKEAVRWANKANQAVADCPLQAADYDVALLLRWKKLLLDRIKEMDTLKIYFEGNLN